MAVLNGYLTESFVEDNAEFVGKPTWLSNIIAFSDSPDAYLANTAITTTLINNLPISFNQDSNSGYIAAAYSDVFYNRILVEPAEINLGNILGDVTREITIFNAYFNSKTLNSINTLGFDGVNLGTEISAPKTFNALEETTQTVEILTTGPTETNALINYNFTDSIDIRSVLITGSRVVVFPYYAMSPLNERLIWKTELNDSYSGSEQRIKLRSKPRQQFSITANVGIDKISSADNLYYGWRQRIWGVPVWGEAIKVNNLLTGDNIINIDTRFSDYRINGLVILWKNDSYFDSFNILSLNENSITIDRNLSRDYNIAYVMPVRLCRLIDDPSRRTNGYNGNVTANFEATDNIEIFNEPAVEQIDLIDVNLQVPFLDGEYITDNYLSRINIIDYETGNVKFFAPWENNRIERQYKIALDGLEEIWIFRKWLHRRSGRLRPFYYPTFENNLEILNTGTIFNNITIKNNENASQGSNRINIGFKLNDNTWLFRKATAYIDNNDGTVNVNLDSSLGIDANQIEISCYLGQKRLTNDIVSIDWLGNQVAEATLSITEIKP